MPRRMASAVAWARSETRSFWRMRLTCCLIRYRYFSISVPARAAEQVLGTLTVGYGPQEIGKYAGDGRPPARAVSKPRDWIC